MTEQEKHQCEAKVWDSSGFRKHQCRKTAKYFENGKWWCGTHAPSKVEAREDERRKQSKRDSDWREEREKAKREMDKDLERIKIQKQTYIPIEDEFAEMLKERGTILETVEEFSHMKIHKIEFKTAEEYVWEKRVIELIEEELGQFSHSEIVYKIRFYDVWILADEVKIPVTIKTRPHGWSE